ncbi:MAG: hypothetical protein JWN59_162 [Sphingomonas bacterium]|nr:hypothetical protein [Sphingomonas bacterium]MDB5684891.1 hypothetical protein [Sphingomonas bacterium]
MSERDSPAPSVTLGRVAVRGGGRAAGAVVASNVAAALATATAGATQPLRIETLRLRLPAGASRAEIARAIGRALQKADGRR